MHAALLSIPCPPLPAPPPPPQLLWQWCATLLAALATVGLWWLANTKGWLAARGADAKTAKDANRPRGVLAATWEAIRKVGCQTFSAYKRCIVYILA